MAEIYVFSSTLTPLKITRVYPGFERLLPKREQDSLLPMLLEKISKSDRFEIPIKEEVSEEKGQTTHVQGIARVHGNKAVGCVWSDTEEIEKGEISLEFEKTRQARFLIVQRTEVFDYISRWCKEIQIKNKEREIILIFQNDLFVQGLETLKVVQKFETLQELIVFPESLEGFKVITKYLDKTPKSKNYAA